MFAHNLRWIVCKLCVFRFSFEFFLSHCEDRIQFLMNSDHECGILCIRENDWNVWGGESMIRIQLGEILSIEWGVDLLLFFVAFFAECVIYKRNERGILKNQTVPNGVFHRKNTLSNMFLILSCKIFIYFIYSFDYALAINQSWINCTYIYMNDNNYFL